MGRAILALGILGLVTSVRAMEVGVLVRSGKVNATMEGEQKPGRNEESPYGGLQDILEIEDKQAEMKRVAKDIKNRHVELK
jgi:hypothetical protein